jgi:hypothetical protein
VKWIHKSLLAGARPDVSAVARELGLSDSLIETACRNGDPVCWLPPSAPVPWLLPCLGYGVTVVHSAQITFPPGSLNSDFTSTLSAAGMVQSMLKGRGGTAGPIGTSKPTVC